MSLQLTNQADYATRAMFCLAKNGHDRLVPSNEIAEKMNISPMFLSRINSLLSLAGLINTRRGARGGISLAKEPSEISLYDVIAAVDGPVVLRHCHSDPGACERREECEIRPVWDGINDMLVEKLKSISLQDLVDHNAIS
ncbi:MAG: Rrf2 family transcriptional regulator [Anaerolineaceae bacterium]